MAETRRDNLIYALGRAVLGLLARQRGLLGARGRLLVGQELLRGLLRGLGGPRLGVLGEAPVAGGAVLGGDSAELRAGDVRRLPRLVGELRIRGDLCANKKTVSRGWRRVHLIYAPAATESPRGSGMGKRSLATFAAPAMLARPRASAAGPVVFAPSGSARARRASSGSAAHRLSSAHSSGQTALPQARGDRTRRTTSWTTSGTG